MEAKMTPQTNESTRVLLVDDFRGISGQRAESPRGKPGL